MSRYRAFIVLALVAAAGCTGGGGGGPPTQTAADPEPEGPTVPGPPTAGDPEASGPATPTRPGLPRPPPIRTCLPTAAYGCLMPTTYRDLQEGIALRHEGQTDYNRQWGLAAINAAEAYANLELAKGVAAAPGAGVTVGLVDSGIDLEHPLFTGDVTEEFLLTAADEAGDGRSHGTSVASVIAADPEGLVPGQRHLGFRGVARGAGIRMFAIPLGTDDGRPYNPVSLQGFDNQDEAMASVVTHALSRSVDILSASISYSGIIENYTEAQLRNSLGSTIAAMAQSGAADKTILVIAGGNAQGKSCIAGTHNCVGGSVDPAEEGTIDATSVEMLSGLPVWIPELRGHSIAVVAVREGAGSDRRPGITSFSNRCGIAAEWCIAAPGHSVRVAIFGEINGSAGTRGIGNANGTSYAAPMVAGGLAIMKQLFRDQLSNTDLVERLFRTADKEAPYSDTAIYGQGLMDLGSATVPVGVPVLTMGESATGAGVDVQVSSIMSGQAFGDGLTRSLAGQEIAAFDSLGAPFWYRLSDFAYRDPGPTMSRHLDRLFAGPRLSWRRSDWQPSPRSAWNEAPAPRNSRAVRSGFGVLKRAVDAADGHLSLAEDALTLDLKSSTGLTASTFSTADNARRAPVSGLSFTYRPSGALAGFRVGWLAERRTLLGAAAAGVFGRVSANTAFAGVSAAGQAGAWRLFADAELGAVTPRARDGMITAMSPMTTSAFSFVAAWRTAARDTLSIGLSQALRVEGGQATLSVPVGRTRQGEVMRSSLQADLSPSGRQLEVSARWARQLAARGELVAGATLTREPGHDARADPALRLLAGWRARF